MKIEILKQNDTSSELFDFLQKSVNAGLFHYPSFLNYHSPDKFPLPNFQPYHFLFTEDKKITGFIPGTLISNKEGKTIYKTPFASSYGGLVFIEKLHFQDFEEIFNLFINHLSNIADIIEYAPVCNFYASPSENKLNYHHFLLLKNDFSIIKAEMVLAVKKSDDNPIEKRFDKKIQTELRQAFRNDLKLEITFKVEEDVYELLIKSQERLGGKPTHSFRDLQKLCGMFPGKIMTFKAISSGRTIAAIICFSINNRVLNTFYIFDDIQFRNLKPNHFNYYHVLKFAFENGYEFVDFGPSTFGFEPNYPLIFFKEKYDADPFLRVTYQKKF
jgi:hypothetical protein